MYMWPEVQVLSSAHVFLVDRFSGKTHNNRNDETDSEEEDSEV